MLAACRHLNLMPHSLPKLAIITPAMAEANNGNWRTAHRWQSLLQHDFKTILLGDWSSATPTDYDAVIALHARRSAPAIVQLRDACPNKALIVVLTGTDLYHDLATDRAAQHSLNLADALIVLQDDAIQFVPRVHRHKTHVVYQSAKSLSPALKPSGQLDCVVVGHLRYEKSPETIFDLVPVLPPNLPIRILHIGAPLDAALAARAVATALSDTRYRWAGAMPHGLTRAAIKRAHLLIHPSILEGGANVIVEAIVAGTPVLASHMSGNIGMLGQDYAGYFPVGDHRALLERLTQSLQPNFLTRLNIAAHARAKFFTPSHEQAALKKILSGLLA